MSNGHPESGDHQSEFSTSANYFPNELMAAGNFMPIFNVDSGDVYLRNNRIAFYPDDRNPPFYSPDYQLPLVAAASVASASSEANFQYLKELETDKWFLASLSQSMSAPCFSHASKLLDDEIARVESNMSRDMVASEDKTPVNDELPVPEGELVNLEEKVVVPVDTNPEYNFIGRLMGPRGMTIKRLEQETGCRLLVRGRGSIKNSVKEDALRCKPGFEHLNENLHILVQAKDAMNRAQIKLAHGVEIVKQMLTPVANDELKQRQMRELAIINGTYRPVQRAFSSSNAGEIGGTTTADALFYEQGQNFF